MSEESVFYSKLCSAYNLSSKDDGPSRNSGLQSYLALLSDADSQEWASATNSRRECAKSAQNTPVFRVSIPKVHMDWVVGKGGVREIEGASKASLQVKREESEIWL